MLPMQNEKGNHDTGGDVVLGSSGVTDALNSSGLGIKSDIQDSRLGYLPACICSTSTRVANTINMYLNPNASLQAKAFEPKVKVAITEIEVGDERPESAAWSQLGLSLRLSYRDEDTRFWWATTGFALATLLSNAGYSIESQYRHLMFFISCVIPELGPAPHAEGQTPRWKSFMTDDGTPIELSWDWGSKNSAPSIRYSIEPIGRDAGTPTDPLNEYAGLRLFRKLHHILPNTNLEWFNHFSQELLIFDRAGMKNNEARNPEKHESRFFVAYDIHENDIIVKAYFFPAFKAMQTGQSKLTVVADAITRLPNYRASDFQAFDALRKYMMLEGPRDTRLEAEIFAIDCTRPADSRLKLYVRSRSTTFDSIRATMTLCGQIHGSRTDQGLEELRDLWNLVLGRDDDPFPSDMELPHAEHRTAGILYYFEIRPGKALPTPKIYIPVRHYGRDDYSIYEGLSAYLRSRQQGVAEKKYGRALTSML